MLRAKTQAAVKSPDLVSLSQPCTHLRTLGGFTEETRRWSLLLRCLHGSPYPRLAGERKELCVVYLLLDTAPLCPCAHGRRVDRQAEPTRCQNIFQGPELGPKWWVLCPGTCCHFSICVSHLALCNKMSFKKTVQFSNIVLMSLWQRTFLWFREQDSRHADGRASIHMAWSPTERNDLLSVGPASFTLRWKYGSQQWVFSSVYRHVGVSHQGKRGDLLRANGGHTGLSPTT